MGALVLFTFSAATQILVSKANSWFDLSMRLFKKAEEKTLRCVIFEENREKDGGSKIELHFLYFLGTESCSEGKSRD